jgi:hypothetical protein
VSRLVKAVRFRRELYCYLLGLDLDVSEAKELLSLAKLALGNEKREPAYESVLSTFGLLSR